MRDRTFLRLVILVFCCGCTVQKLSQEPRVLRVKSHVGIKQDEAKLNATYSYLVYLYHSQEGDVDAARHALSRTLKFDSTSNTLRLEYAQDLYVRGLYASAREALSKLKDDSDDAQKLFIQVLVREQNLSEARVALDRWLEKNPGDENFYSLRARIEIEEQNVGEADRIVSLFLKAIPDSSQAHFLRGRVRQLQNDEKAAVKDYKHALELDSQNIAAAAHLAFLQDVMGRQEEALQTYAWLADMTDNPEFHKRLGVLYLERSDTRRAIAALEAYSRHQPNDNQNLARLASLYFDLKDYEQAEFKLSKLVLQQPDNEALRYYYGAALYELNKKSEALQQVRKIARTSKLYPERLRIELQSLWDIGQQNTAKNMAQKLATELLANSVAEDEAIYPVLYSFLNQYNMKELGRELLQSGIKTFPLSAQLKYNQALAWDEEGKLKEALALGQELLKMDPKNPALQNLVGYLLANLGLDLKRADRLIDEALKARPNDPFIMDSRAWVRFKQNRLSEALSILEKAHELKPEEPIILVHIGDVLAKLGRIQEAMSRYEKALALGIESTPERIRVQEALARYQQPGDRKISCSPGKSCPMETSP